jgi:general secretion pathway protein A
MYTEQFRLRKEPFRMTPDPGMLYLTPQHREILAGLAYAVEEAKGFVVLTGEAGTGKTTLLRRTLANLSSARIKASVVFNPLLTQSEFLQTALAGWGVQDPPVNKPAQLQLIRNILLDAKTEQKIVLLVVDEAHDLSMELLEEIRLLGNFEDADQKLLQIVLTGQSELATLLNRHELRQLKQRIAVRLKIAPLSPTEVEECIGFRWSEAGGTAPPFSRDAYGLIAAYSRGIPRLVNSICDNALTLAFAEGLALVTAEHVEEACRDLEISREPSDSEANSEGLILKSYYSTSLGAAIELGRKELGEEALLVDARPMPDAAFPGEYEVIYGMPASRTLYREGGVEPISQPRSAQAYKAKPGEMLDMVRGAWRGDLKVRITGRRER